MRLTVVGCAGSYPGPDSPASCYLLEADHDGRTWRVLLDLGNGALGALHHHADPLEVDAVLLSHLHPDHCMDLCGYYVLRTYHPRGAVPPIPVWGPAGTAVRMATAYGLEETPGMRETFDFRSFAVERRGSVGPFSFQAYEVVHPVPAYAVRVSAGGKVLTYSGDTAPCDALVEAARDADLFLAEASFREVDPNPPGIHLTGKDAGEAATAAGAKHLVLTHVPAWFDEDTCEAEARAAYDGPISRAAPGAVHEL